VALILVLGAITILTVFLTELQERTSADLAAAIADRDALKAEYVARSGVSLARLLIASEPAVRRAVGPLIGIMFGGKSPQIPIWEYSDMVLGPFNDEAGASAFAGTSGLDVSSGENLGLSGGHFVLTVVDEDSKINLNTAAKGSAAANLRLAQQILGLIAAPQYNELFEARDLDGQFSDRATICGSLVDWADFDEDLFGCDPYTSSAGSKGAEDSFYQTIGLGYVRKNAAYDSLEEARLVRGMGDDLWATFIDPDPSDPKKRVMTVWGQDRINVNSANPQALWAIICGNEPTAPMCVDMTQAQAFLMGVSFLKTFALGVPIFASDKDFVRVLSGQTPIGSMLAAIGVQPVNFTHPAEVTKQVTTESKVFSLYVDGVVPGRRRETRVRIHAVVDFRKAQEIGNPFSPLLGAQQQQQPQLPPGVTPGERPGSTPLPSNASGLDVARAMSMNPAGNVIYWRIE
jgi:general secretion pathway protein K